MPTLTINLTTPQAQRVAVAVGRIENLEGPADIAQVRAKVIEFLKQMVQVTEGDEAARAARLATPDLGVE